MAWPFQPDRWSGDQYYFRELDLAPACGHIPGRRLPPIREFPPGNHSSTLCGFTRVIPPERL